MSKSSLNAREHAVRLLARREHTRKELRQKLQQKKVSSSEIDTLVTELSDKGYVDDQRFGEMFVRHRVNAGYGPLRIRQDLQQKGLAGDAIEAALQSVEVDWQELALQRYRAKYRAPCGHDEREYARRARHLAGRGFPFELINKVIASGDKLLAGQLIDTVD